MEQIALRRVIESLRLEKISKIIKSNRQPSTTVPAKMCVWKVVALGRGETWQCCGFSRK